MCSVLGIGLGWLRLSAGYLLLQCEVTADADVRRSAMDQQQSDNRLVIRACSASRHISSCLHVVAWWLCITSRL
jgi:hypothetical protein